MEFTSVGCEKGTHWRQWKMVAHYRRLIEGKHLTHRCWLDGSKIGLFHIRPKALGSKPSWGAVILHYWGCNSCSVLPSFQWLFNLNQFTISIEFNNLCKLIQLGLLQHRGFFENNVTCEVIISVIVFQLMLSVQIYNLCWNSKSL